MSEILLPIQKKPIFECNLTLMFQFSILEAHVDNIIPWAACKFTNIRFIPETGNKFELVRPANWFPKEKVFLRNRYSFRTDFPDRCRFDVLRMMILFILNGQYVNGSYDAYYIPVTDNYLKTHCYKNYLIYGVNEEKRIFHLLSYTHGYEYEPFELSFDEFMESLNKREDKTIAFSSVGINPEYCFEPDEKERLDGLYDFEHSINRKSPLIPRDTAVYGRKALEKYEEYIRNVGYLDEYPRRDSVLAINDFAYIKGINYMPKSIFKKRIY